MKLSTVHKVRCTMPMEGDVMNCETNPLHTMLIDTPQCSINKLTIKGLKQLNHVQERTMTATRLSCSRTRLLTKSGRRTPIADPWRMGIRVENRAGFVVMISVNTVSTLML